MRKYWIIALQVFGLVFAASLASRFPVNTLASDEFHQPSIVIDQLMTAKDLPIQSFDAF